MTPDEARSLGRAIRTVCLEAGLSQLKLAVAVDISGGRSTAGSVARFPPPATGPSITVNLPRSARSGRRGLRLHCCGHR